MKPVFPGLTPYLADACKKHANPAWSENEGRTDSTFLEAGDLIGQAYTSPDPPAVLLEAGKRVEILRARLNAASAALATAYRELGIKSVHD